VISDDHSGIHDPITGQLRDVNVYDGVVLETHGPDICRNTSPCTIHSPSEHHMSHLSQVWSGMRQMMMRRCDHDVLHPDPDDIKIRDVSSLREALRATNHDCCSHACCSRVPVVMSLVPRQRTDNGEDVAAESKPVVHAVFVTSMLPRCGGISDNVTLRRDEVTCRFCAAILRVNPLTIQGENDK
jgi:hypothetical protein